MTLTYTRRPDGAMDLSDDGLCLIRAPHEKCSAFANQWFDEALEAEQSALRRLRDAQEAVEQGRRLISATAQEPR